MFTSLRALALGLVAALAFSGSAALASPPQIQKMVVGGSYSPTLGAEFRVENFFLPAFGQFTSVRLVSVPEWNSPLRNLGLQPGDVITRLDGVRVDNLAELENHYSWTQVRYIKTGTQIVKIGNIFINQNVGPMPGPMVPGGNAP